jgi:hypothetical protein
VAAQQIRQQGVTTLKASTVQRTVKAKTTTTGGGSGLFALLALGGMICFVNYHAVIRPVVRPTPRVNYQPAIPKFAPGPQYFNYTGAPARGSSVPPRWVVQPPPMPQPPSIRIEPSQAPVYWGPYGQRGGGRGEKD